MNDHNNHRRCDGKDPAVGEVGQQFRAQVTMSKKRDRGKPPAVSARHVFGLFLSEAGNNKTVHKTASAKNVPFLTPLQIVKL